MDEKRENFLLRLVVFELHEMQNARQHGIAVGIGLGEDRGEERREHCEILLRSELDVVSEEIFAHGARHNAAFFVCALLHQRHKRASKDEIDAQRLDGGRQQRNQHGRPAMDRVLKAYSWTVVLFWSILWASSRIRFM